MAVFDERYRQSGTALALCGNSTQQDLRCPNFDDWSLWIHGQWKQRLKSEQHDVDSMDEEKVATLEGFTRNALLCCPEDHKCFHVDCKQNRLLCPDCKVPICHDCALSLKDNKMSPEMLINDNWIAYIDAFIYEAQVTWMEKTVTNPYWTGLTLFTLGARESDKKPRRGKRHKLHDAMYASKHRTAYKGQLFSAPMDWRSIQEQLEAAAKDVRFVDLPMHGEILEKRVKLSITSGLVDLNKYVRQATVRYDVMVRLIAMHKAAREPDYVNLDMNQVAANARLLNPSNEPQVPSGLQHVLDPSDDEKLDDATDKAATPAERLVSEESLLREMDRARPLTLVVQRESDAQKNVEASRSHALGTVTEMNLVTGSSLLDQFETCYIPRVFNLSLPWQVGGPDFQGQGGRWRRRFEDSPQLSLTNYTAMMARRVEAQIRWDWDLNPGLHSLSFASKVNKSVGIALRKGLGKLTDAHEEPSDTNVGLAMKRLYEMLQDGEYKDESGKRKPIKGDMSKLHRLIGMSPLQEAIVRNMFFMSAKIEGTRQIRKMIGHVITGGRVVYGLPVYMTVTPSERHSGLAIRLSRYRRNDPGLRVGSPEFSPYAGYDAPSLYGPDNVETAELDLPEYDLRRLMTNRDPLCCLYAFLVNVKVILPTLYGFLATERQLTRHS